MRMNSIPTMERKISREESCFNILGSIMRNFFLSLLFPATILFSTPLLAAPPAAPTGLCLQTTEGTQCAEDDTTPSSPSNIIAPKKVNTNNFHPGHYIRVGDKESVTRINQVLDVPGFVGLKKGYVWRDIESSEGVYDFSQIESDLAYLKSVGKQLWIVIQDTEWSTSNQPKVPAYMWTNSKYGCDPKYYGTYQRSAQQGGWLPCIWNENVLARYKALYAALGKRFNKEPNFEGMNLGETSTGSTDWGYTKEKEKDAFYAKALALKQAFPDKSVTQMMNYATFDLTAFADWLSANGIGIAGPDVHLMPEKINLQTNVYPLYVKYHSIVPTGPDVQWDNYERYNSLVGRANTAEELLLGAISYTNPWYMFWERRDPYFTDDVIPAIKKHGNLPSAKQFYDSKN